jgi:lysophospholipase L1-like esterase
MNRTRLALTLILTTILMAADKPATTQPSAADKWAKHYDDRVALFQRENAAAKNIVIVGSSHVEWFDAAKYLPGRRVVNRGIGSDRIGVDGHGVLGRLDNSVFDCNPGFILLENGVNDLGELSRNGTPSIDEIEAGYRKVVGEIRTRLPKTPLVIIGLFPTRDRFASLKPMVVEFNARLQKIAADYQCPFMEVYKPLADSEGLLRKEYTSDGLHLNDAGKRVWAELMERVLPPQTKPTTQP